MSTMPALAIVYQGPSRLLSLATVDDKDLLVQVATAALREAVEKAEAERDPGLAAIQREEAVKLWRVLRWFLPDLELRNPAEAAALVQ